MTFCIFEIVLAFTFTGNVGEDVGEKVNLRLQNKVELQTKPRKNKCSF